MIFSHVAWYIYRHDCLHLGCEFDCPLNSGCFTHDRTSLYTFTVRCWDAYGSDDTKEFKLYIEENTPPVLTGASKNS